MKKKIFSILLSILFIFYSCKKEEQEAPESNNDRLYYPVKTGDTLYYDCIFINIDKAVNVFDTTIYELKEIFESTFTDETGNTNFRIEQYTKQNNDSLWVFSKASYVMVSNKTIERVDDNIRIVNINFPLLSGKQWDGNSKNTYAAKTFEIIEIDATDVINNKTYNNSILSILQEDNENMIEKYFAIEKYAKNKGLVYKKTININELEPLPGTPWQNRINRGTIYEQSLKQ
jgi:hypothetical protein